MSYIIDPSIEKGATTEDLLSITDADLDKAAKLFEEGPLDKMTTLAVSAGTLRFPKDSGTTNLEFTDYEAKVSASFRTTDGDRVLVTVDGGMLNVTDLMEGLRTAVHDARL